MSPSFKGGSNIAIKIPKFKFDQTVRFYKNVLKLPYLGKYGESHVFQFSSVRLWLDRVENYSQTDVWLEVHTDDVEQAKNYLQDHNVPIRDEIEPLDGVDGHWISDPAGVICLVSKEDEQQQV